MSEIRVNLAQWQAVPEEYRKAIVAGLRSVGSLKIGDEVVGDADEPEFTAETVMDPMWNPIKDGCKALCDTTSAAAVAWCTANTGGVALAACLAAANAARRECRRRC